MTTVPDPGTFSGQPINAGRRHLMIVAACWTAVCGLRRWSAGRSRRAAETGPGGILSALVLSRMIGPVLP